MPFIFARAFKKTDGWDKNDVTWFLRRRSNQVSVNARNSSRVCSSLVYPYFKLDVEQDKIRQALLIKQESE